MIYLTGRYRIAIGRLYEKLITPHAHRHHDYAKGGIWDCRVEEAEKLLILNTLKRYEGRKLQARKLGISVRKLSLKLAVYAEQNHVSSH